MAIVELRRLADGRWTWTYRDEDVELSSNDEYDSAADAEAAASSAYPGVTITRAIAGSAPETPATRRGLAFC